MRPDLDKQDRDRERLEDEIRGLKAAIAATEGRIMTLKEEKATYLRTLRMAEANRRML